MLSSQRGRARVYLSRSRRTPHVIWSGLFEWCSLVLLQSVRAMRLDPARLYGVTLPRGRTVGRYRAPTQFLPLTTAPHRKAGGARLSDYFQPLPFPILPLCPGPIPKPAHGLPHLVRAHNTLKEMRSLQSPWPLWAGAIAHKFIADSSPPVRVPICRGGVLSH